MYKSMPWKFILAWLMHFHPLLFIFNLFSDDDGVLREVWFGLGLSPLLTNLTNNPRFPTSPDEYIVLDKFEAPPNAGDGYGQRLSTYYKVKF